MHVWHQRNMNEGKVVVADLELEPAHRLNEWSRLDVAYSASQLNHTNIRFLARLIHWNLGDAIDPILNRVRNVREDLRNIRTVFHGRSKTLPGPSCRGTPLCAELLSERFLQVQTDRLTSFSMT